MSDPSTNMEDNITENYQFFFTGGNKQMLLEGIQVELRLNMNPIQCADHLLKYIQNKVDITGKRLIVYLAGGIPFISGTLSDMYLNKEISVKKVIYGVLTRNISDEILNNFYYELCNVSNADRKLLISPLCESTICGLSDMACLLGCINYNCNQSDLFISASASVIHFPPLITSLKRIINNDKINGRDIITVCSTLFTFFRSILPFKCPNEQVYEYCLQLSILITQIENKSEKLPITSLDLDDNEESNKLFFNLANRSFIYFWNGDVNDDFPLVNFEIKNEKYIENSSKIISPFNPVAPFSINNLFECAIVKGKDHEYFYLMKSCSKAHDNLNFVEILDPLNGITESFDIEKFAISQFDNETDELPDLVDEDKVKQLIMLDIDISGSMNNDLKGSTIKIATSEISRILYANQYISIFSDKLWGYHIPCLKGLATFNNNISILCNLTTYNGKFEKYIESPRGQTKLFDSIEVCSSQIINFKNNNLGNEVYRNALNRIFIISDGNDAKSIIGIKDVIKILIKSKIIVDAIVIDFKGDIQEFSKLITICHITGGVALLANDINKIISILEQSAFIKYEERKKSYKPLIPGDISTIPSRIKPEQITDEFIDKLNERAYFDTQIISNEIDQANIKQDLVTPSCACAKNEFKMNLSSRYKRILKELHYAAYINNDKSYDYDNEIKIMICKSSIDQWKVFLKGSEDTPYSSKWWYLYVTFPELYPSYPPSIRFISVPYHLNVSADGSICTNILEKRYMRSIHVIEILQQIREIFLLFDLDNAFRMDAYVTFLHDKDEYERLAKESADKNTKNDYKDYFNGQIIDDVAPDFMINADRLLPYFKISPISGKELNPKRTIKTSSGINYDENEYLRLIESRTAPICLVNGVPFTE